ncbi:MAG: response regulator [Myxococcales bacterium]|nr:response regulator [Myxococcales bacterium]
MNSPRCRVLLIEDDPSMRGFLRSMMASHGYALTEAGTAADGMAQLAAVSPDLVLLDLGLPDGDGIEVTRRLREWSRTPIIVLSARGQESDKIHALDAGADDYLTKPFSIGELLARIRVALRHAQQSGQATQPPEFALGSVRVDLSLRQVFRDGSEVHLTPTEYKLLTLLFQYAGRVVTHRQLLVQVWGPQFADQSHYLRVYMAQLRHKLEADPTRPRYLRTETGVGYRLKLD